jgi:hypothetical protein
MKMSELVGKYVELREQRAQHKAEFDMKVAKIDQVLEKIEAKLLEVFEQTGMDSVKTEFGTAYSSNRSTASVADKEAFMEFVKSNDEWPLLEVRANKSSVEQFKEEHGELPPGVNWRVERVVGVRRSS